MHARIHILPLHVLVVQVLLMVTSHLCLADHRPLIRDFRSTDMVSTAGVGVAGSSSVNAIYLNPASSALSPHTQFYSQYNNSSMSENTDVRMTESLEDIRSPRGYSLALTDSASAKLKGGFGYVHQQEMGIRRQRYSFQSSALSSETLSMGFSYFYTRDQDLGNSPFEDYKNSFHRLDYAGTLSFGHGLTFAAVYQDIFRSQPHFQRAILGVEYSFNPTVMILADWSFSPIDSIRHSRALGAALKFNIHGNFSIKGGLQRDRLFDQQTYGLGASWTVASFIFDLAIGQIQSDHNQQHILVRPEEKIKEYSLAVTYRM